MRGERERGGETFRKFTKYGLRTKLIDIVLDDGKRTVKAIPQQIQMHAYKNQVNNITFMRVDPETIVKVPIPVKVTGQDDCPGDQARRVCESHEVDDQGEMSERSDSRGVFRGRIEYERER